MRARAALVGLGLALMPAAAPAEPSVARLPLPFAVKEMRGPGSHAAQIVPSLQGWTGEKPSRERPHVVVWGPEGGAALFLRDGKVEAATWRSSDADEPPVREAPAGALPGSRLQSAGPLTVSLTDPTGAYRHGALGGTREAASLTIAERQPVKPGGGAQTVPVRRSTVPAGPGAVFEDREPRLADLDRDGSPEIVVVKSYLDRGSALAVIGERDGAWTIIAETPPIGEPQRWLDPAAIADFTGDGAPDIALVRTPHRTGTLQLWTFRDGKLALGAEKDGYANHVFGSAAQDLAAAVDLDGDGVPELALPTLDRKSLAVVSFRGGIAERWRVALPARAATGVAALGSGRDAHILVGLEDGTVADVRP